MCVALTADFLLYGTRQGSLHQFYLADMGYVNEYRPSADNVKSRNSSGGGGITAIFPNDSGTRCIYLDEQQNGWLYSPINDERLALPKLPVCVGLIYN